MTRSFLENQARRVMNNELLTRDETLTLTQIESDRVMGLLYWANQIRSCFHGRRVSFCCITSGRQGGCDQDCAWCGQSGCFSPSTKKVQQAYSESSLLEAAERAKQSKADCFCVVNSGRKPVEKDLQLLERLNETLRAKGGTACLCFHGGIG